MSAKPFHEQMADKMAGMGGDDDGDESSGADYDTALDEAIGDLIDAVHSKDRAGACEAFKNAMSLFHEHEGEGEPDGDEAPGGHAAMLLIPHGKG